MIDTRRMTDRARRILALAESNATRFHSVRVEPQHLLLGLAEEGSGVAANVLRRSGAEFKQLLSAMNSMNSVGDPALGVPLSWSAEAEEIVARALDEARKLNHNYVGTEHLLLAISRKPPETVAKLLTACGVLPKDLRCETYNLLGHSDLEEQEGLSLA